MKVVFLAAGSSIHTVRWVNGLANAGYEIVLVTQHEVTEPISSAVKVRMLPYSGGKGYFLNALALRKILSEEKPDILNAHYASGYGTTAQLSGFKPLVLSVWGSDVYDFPTKSPIHKWLVRRNLLAATKVASTSNVMANQTMSIASLDISITPFGIDTTRFSPRKKEGDGVVIGTVKTMASKYGIDTLLEAFAMLVQAEREFESRNYLNWRLRLVGDGPDIDKLKRQASDLGIADMVDFVGKVPHSEVPSELAKFDIYVALSRLDSESFGVAVLEASACGLPVVVSDAGGLPEVVEEYVTGYIIPRDMPEAAAFAINDLIIDSSKRKAMGEAGRKRVEDLYSWDQSVHAMSEVYAEAFRLRH